MNSQLNSLTMRPAPPTGLVANAGSDPLAPAWKKLLEVRAPHTGLAR